jgi:uncharacterized membrane protein YdbT with pleckstrin-like domain
MNREEINSVLEPQEQIVWQGMVNRRVLYFSLIISLVAVLSVSFFLFSKDTIHYTSNGIAKTLAGSTLGMIVLVIGLLFSLLGFFSKLVKNYFITNKRILIRSGLIGTDFNSIYFTQIKTANVNVGLLDKIFGVGTINIDTGKIETVQSGTGANQRTSTRTAYDKLIHIAAPYEVYKYFQTTLTGREESLYSGRADRENIAKNI